MQFGIKYEDGVYKWHLYEREIKSSPEDNLYFPLSQPHYLNENKIQLCKGDAQIAVIESDSSQLLHECLRKIIEMEKNKVDLTYSTFIEIAESYKKIYIDETKKKISLEEDQDLISNFKFLEIVHFKYGKNGDKIPIYIFVYEKPTEDEYYSAMLVKKNATK